MRPTRPVEQEREDTTDQLVLMFLEKYMKHWKHFQCKVIKRDRKNYLEWKKNGCKTTKKKINKARPI